MCSVWDGREGMCLLGEVRMGAALLVFRESAWKEEELLREERATGALRAIYPSSSHTPCCGPFLCTVIARQALVLCRKLLPAAGDREELPCSEGGQHAGIKGLRKD